MPTRKNLLIVDDDQGFLSSFRLCFEPVYKVFACSSFAEAAQFLKNSRIDVLILDYNLGRETGHEFIDQMRKLAIDIPVIVVSGQLDIEMSLGFLKRRIFDFLEKPVSKKALEESIQNAIKKAEGIEEMKIDYVHRKVAFAGQDITLTPIEFQLLELFISRQGQHISRTQIVQSVWGQRYVSKNTLDTHLINLKKKVPAFAQALKSIYGSGYCYEA